MVNLDALDDLNPRFSRERKQKQMEARSDAFIKALEQSGLQPLASTDPGDDGRMVMRLRSSHASNYGALVS